MSETKTFVFPEGAGGNSGNLDPNLLLSMMNNNGGFGGNGNWLWVIFLFFLNGWGRGGNWGGCAGAENLASTAERDMLMQAINGNREALGNLASTLNCDINAVQAAINNVQSAVQSVGNQVGLTGQQVINSIQQGNMSLASQLSQCCCDNKLLQAQNFASTMSRIDQLANGVTQGFAASAYETAQQTCAINQNVSNGVQALKDTANANNASILAKLGEMQTNALQDKLSASQAEVATLKAAINNGQQTQAFAAMLAPIQAELNAIKAAQPNTITTPYQPFVAVPNAVAYQYGLGGVNNNGFWG